MLYLLPIRLPAPPQGFAAAWKLSGNLSQNRISIPGKTNCGHLVELFLIEFFLFLYEFLFCLLSQLFQTFPKPPQLQQLGNFLSLLFFEPAAT